MEGHCRAAVDTTDVEPDLLPSKRRLLGSKRRLLGSMHHLLGGFVRLSSIVGGWGWRGGGASGATILPCTKQVSPPPLPSHPPSTPSPLLAEIFALLLGAIHFAPPPPSPSVAFPFTACGRTTGYWLTNPPPLAYRTTPNKALVLWRS